MVFWQRTACLLPFGLSTHTHTHFLCKKPDLHYTLTVAYLLVRHSPDGARGSLQEGVVCVKTYSRSFRGTYIVMEQAVPLVAPSCTQLSLSLFFFPFLISYSPRLEAKPVGQSLQARPPQGVACVQWPVNIQTCQTLELRAEGARTFIFLSSSLVSNPWIGVKT